ncbi:MAG TPA: alpha/beta hydrolase [Campylobacterales bacterium]|nr:alpha/beta hydrolase [Campylobacterales bacterium]
MLKNILLFSILLFFSACSTKAPITWQKRVLEQKEFNQSNLSYYEYGDPKNRTLLFLHGFGESKETWRFITPALSKRYHLILVDLKGFGSSPKIEDDAYSVYDQAKEIASFIKKKQLNHLTVVGRSFGGGVALVLALMQKDQLIEPRIDNLILINTMAYKQNLPSMMRLLNQPVIGYLGIHMMPNEWMAQEAYEYAFYNDSLIPKESVAYSSYYLSQPSAKYVYLQTVNQLLPDDADKIQRRYREIGLPTLILWGREDVSIGVRMAHRLHRDLKKSYLKIFPKVGHMPNEEVPNKVIAEIVKFMEENR